MMSTDGTDSTLHRIDLDTAATMPVGTAAGTSILAIAIDAHGHVFGYDDADHALVRIETLARVPRPPSARSGPTCPRCRRPWTSTP
jgi:hypothetical protein